MNGINGEKVSELKDCLGKTECDILIIGAGFSGCFLLYNLRKKGYKVKVFESADGLGGTWRWNRYPGARVDSHIPYYELSIPEVWESWSWKEKFPGWKELQLYFDHVDEKCEISKDVDFNTKVVEAFFDPDEGKWNVITENKKLCKAKYLLPCVGFAAKRYIPDWKNLDKFKGIVCHSSFWPKEDFDVTGKRCAVIGTGSTGVQITQEWGKRGKSLVVFQRTPNLALPMGQRILDPEEQEKEKQLYPELFQEREKGFGGFEYTFIDKNVFDDSPETREEFLESIWKKGTFEFWDEKKRNILVPDDPPHPFGTKRPSLERDYYETFNNPNVDVVSIKQNPISEFTESGLILQDGTSFDFDIIAFATGFDAITGSLIAAGIKDIHGNPIEESWKDGVKTYLGMCIRGFPNMFFTYGPQAPTAFSNGPTCAEIQSRFIIDTIDKMEKEGIKYIHPDPEAQEKFVEKIHAFSNQSLFPLADSWYMGANIPGKKREMLNYLGGIPLYAAELKESLDQGLLGMMQISLPINLEEAIVLKSLSYPFAHYNLSDEEIKKLLTSDGDYLVNIKNEPVICLFFDNKIHEFSIVIALDEYLGISYEFGKDKFSSLFDLVNHLTEARIILNDEEITCVFRKPILKSNCTGSLGFGSVVTSLNSPNAVKKHFVRVLKSEITSIRSILTTLEDLTKLKHENLAEIKDYFSFHLSETPLIIVLQNYFEERLDSVLQNLQHPFKVKEYVRWTSQLSSVLCYLYDQGIPAKFSSLRSCRLSFHRNLIFTDIWFDDYSPSIETEGMRIHEINTHNDYWRSTPMEILIGSHWTGSAQSWTFACLAHQIFTHGRLLPRLLFPNVQDFLTSGIEPMVFFSGSEVKQKLKENELISYNKFLKLDKAGVFPRCPKKLIDLLTEIIISHPDKRPSMEQARNICESESIIFKLAGIVGNLPVF
ncbi:hypothetical protein FO519_005251 [Halicephalobus sp. NKZ332]|nr:hypothetical protein FO519_005251 [Halicephalobus sp. NKZ332]